ncbi:MAG TPA: hypothetical protein ENF75_02125 [Acidilobales archaeon]|nr:MAG: hypothetical protein B6U85_04150 [Desulfurococcales archaeon ex4484_42]HDD25869.1 hypothetical protein [Acidilobales archaeon]
MIYLFMQSPLGPSVRVHKEVIVSFVSTDEAYRELSKLKGLIRYSLSTYESSKIRDLMFLAKLDPDLIDVIKKSGKTLTVVTIKV